MKITARTAIAAIALLPIAVVSACGGPSVSSAAANGNNAGSGTSAAENGASAAGNGTSTAGDDSNQTPASPSTPGTTTTAPATYNEVVIGAEFAGAPDVSFGNILPGQSVTMQFRVGNLASQSVTVVSITTDTATFSPSADCNGRVLEPGGSCTFSVTFSPAVSGTYSSALNVAITPANIVSQGPTLKGSAGPSSVQGQSISPPASQLAPAGSSSP